MKTVLEHILVEKNIGLIVSFFKKLTPSLAFFKNYGKKSAGSSFLRFVFAKLLKMWILFLK